MKKVLVAKKFNQTGSLVLFSDDTEKINSLFDFLTEEKSQEGCKALYVTLNECKKSN